MKEKDKLDAVLNGNSESQANEPVEEINKESEKDNIDIVQGAGQGLSDSGEVAKDKVTSFDEAEFLEAYKEYERDYLFLHNSSALQDFNSIERERRIIFPLSYHLATLEKRQEDRFSELLGLLSDIQGVQKETQSLQSEQRNELDGAIMSINKQRDIVKEFEVHFKKAMRSDYIAYQTRMRELREVVKSENNPRGKLGFGVWFVETFSFILHPLIYSSTVLLIFFVGFSVFSRYLYSTEILNKAKNIASIESERDSYKQEAFKYRQNFASIEKFIRGMNIQKDNSGYYIDLYNKNDDKSIVYKIGKHFIPIRSDGRIIARVYLNLKNQ